jgi:endonuclease-3 related protein
VPLFNEYHALIVIHGKDVCKKNPLCGRCVLAKKCPAGVRQTAER